MTLYGTYPPHDEEVYRGRSLAYIRAILDCPPKWVSAKDAAEELAEHTIHSYPMAVGAVCFYELEPWGDIGVYVGGGRVLRIRNGQPLLQSTMADPTFIGWVSGQVFREAARSPEPLTD